MTKSRPAAWKRLDQWDTWKRHSPICWAALGLCTVLQVPSSVSCHPREMRHCLCVISTPVSGNALSQILWVALVTSHHQVQLWWYVHFGRPLFPYLGTLFMVSHNIQYPKAWQLLTCLVTVISSWASNPKGLCFLSELSKVIETEALVIPACPFL